MRRLVTLLAICAGLITLLILASGASSRTNDYITFRMPSRNIYCGYSAFSDSPAYLRCEIQSGIRPMPARKKNPECVWGRAVGMRKLGMPSYLCISDTVFDQAAPTLGYGSTWSHNGFSCRSRESGLTCRNAAGHGFFLSRQLTRLS
ncbi:MAG: DUF6636 domain-containing protein [Gaiellaceae bacterium]